jgi:hypothetical protein
MTLRRARRRYKPIKKKQRCEKMTAFLKSRKDEARPAGRAIARRCAPVAMGLVLLAGVAACSASPAAKSAAAGGSTASSGTSTSTAGTGSSAAKKASASKKVVISGLITFKGKLKLSGAHHRKMSFSAFPGVTAPKSSCTHIGTVGTPGAKGRPEHFQIPAPPFGGTVTLAAQVQPYHGPGTYQKTALVAAGAMVTIGSDNYSLTGPGASVSMTFASDGSGMFKFTNAPSTTHGAAALSGTIHWTCSV